MWIDADLGFDPADIVGMVRADKDIVCGIYPKKEIHWREVTRAAREGVPLERLRDHERSFVSNLIDDSPDGVGGDGLIQIAHAGAGFMLIKRASSSMRCRTRYRRTPTTRPRASNSRRSTP